MSKKTDTITPDELTDEELAREIGAAQRIINGAGRDPSFGRPTREEGQRRLDALRDRFAGGLASASATEIIRQLAKSGDTVPTAELARFAGLHALADPAHPAWDALAFEICAPDRPGHGPIWSTGTDAERDAGKSARADALASARTRLVELTASAERRRQVASDEIEAERIARYRARSGV